MRNMLLFWALMVSLIAKAQTDTHGEIPYELQDSTGIGAPDGKLVTREIGVAGGTIASEDGRVELVFPEGALTANTEIRIQPTKNLAPNGVGKSYSFEPSGIHFKKPVRISFHYTEKESEICPPDWMSLGIQDHTGKWTFTGYDTFDSISKTLKGVITHFSGASNINDIQLRPDKYKIPINGSTYIDVVDITRTGTDSAESSLGLAILTPSNPVLWYANTVLHGNNFTGKVRGSSLPYFENNSLPNPGIKLWLAEYTAPEILPNQNPVDISVEIYRKTRNGKVLRKRLHQDIEVYDAYNILLIHKFTGRVGMSSELIDSASCVVWVYSGRVELSDIKNYPPAVLNEGKRGPFREKIITDGALGTLHLTESFSHVKVGKQYPPEVYFEPMSTTILICKIQTSASGIQGEMEPLFSKSLPREINFIANGKVQQYNMTTGQGENYKLIVNPFWEEETN